MTILVRLIRSALAWIPLQPGEIWAQWLTFSATSAVTLPFLLIASSTLIVASMFGGFDPAVYGEKLVFSAMFGVIWCLLFFPVRATVMRHVAGEEPVESGAFIAKAYAATVVLCGLVVIFAAYARDQ